MTKKNKSENVQVIVRIRPLNRKEIEAGYKDCVNIDIGGSSVSVEGAGVEGRTFAFDAVYTNAFAQKDVYLQSIHPVVETVLQGYNGTIFAYGQSGTGKTYSMVGNLDNPKQHGIIPHALEHIFTAINEMKSDKMEYSVQASFVELYNGKCRDLLVDGKLNLELKENAQKLFFVKDLSLWEVKDTMNAMQLMEDGITRREVKATELNSDSSRSHSLFTVYVRTWDKEQDLRTEAKLNLVDLAGSERQSKTGATGDAFKEGANINLSLTALGTVIDCLVKQKPHIPYRSSPLTMLLKDGLGGNSRTVIVGAIGPSDFNAHETVSTLRFIDRAKQIKNKPKLQMDPKDAKIAELLEEVKKYKRQLGLLEDEELDDDDDAAGSSNVGIAPGAGSSSALHAQNSVDSPEKEERRRKSVRMADDEIERLQRRIEELEVALSNAEDAEAADRVEKAFIAREQKLRASMADREAQLQSAIGDLKDRLSLQDTDASDAIGSLDTLITACSDFINNTDKEKQWISTIRVSKRSSRVLSDGTTGVEPTVDDIVRGLRLVSTSGAELRVRRSSMVGGAPVLHINNMNSSPPQDRGAHPPHGAPPTTSTPRLAQVQQSTPTGQQAPALHAQSALHAPSASTSQQPSVTASPTTVQSDVESEFPPQRGKKEKKDKKDKKDKEKDKKEKKAKSSAAILEQKAFLGALPDDEVSRVLQEHQIDPSARAAINDLLQRQRTSLLATFTSRSEEVATDAQSIAGDKEQAAELLAAFTQLQEEVDVLRASSNKQKSQLEKSKAVAEKKMHEVAQLKEHIDALRDELSSQQSKNDSGIKEHEERLIQQFNKKTEALVAKHSKNLAKERKQRESLDHKIDELVAQNAQLEQEYDTKILEFENLMRDYEALKVENLRRFRELHANGFEGSTTPDMPKMKRVVQASMILDRLSGRNSLVKTEEMRPEPSSAPEVLTTSSVPNVSPLPGIHRNVFQRPLPF